MNRGIVRLRIWGIILCVLFLSGCTEAMSEIRTLQDSLNTEAGTVDTEAVDGTETGAVDTEAVDGTETGAVDTEAVDGTETGAVDTEAVDGTEAGKTQDADTRGVFYADLNHDGREEAIQFTVEEEDGRMGEVHVAVYEDDMVLYKEDVPIHATHGYQLYLVTYEGSDYLMRYLPLHDHDMAECSYEIFSLGENDTITLDSSRIELRESHINEVDSAEWYAFAEKENTYFKQAVLIVNTCDGELVCGDPDVPVGYTENFSWLAHCMYPVSDSIEENWNYYVDQTKEIWNLVSSE